MLLATLGCNNSLQKDFKEPSVVILQKKSQTPSIVLATWLIIGKQTLQIAMDQQQSLQKTANTPDSILTLFNLSSIGGHG